MKRIRLLCCYLVGLVVRTDILWNIQKFMKTVGKWLNAIVLSVYIAVSHSCYVRCVWTHEFKCFHCWYNQILWNLGHFRGFLFAFLFTLVISFNGITFLSYNISFDFDMLVHPHSDELCIKSHSSSHTQWLFYMTLAIEHKSKYYCTNIGLDSFQLLSEFYNFLSSSSSFRLFFFCCTISIHLIFIIVWVLAFRAKPCTFVAIYGQCHCH